jgi:phenylacetate-CoA ligase
MTSLAEERAEQGRWKLRPRFAGLAVFDQLLENEFAPPGQADTHDASQLRAVVQFCAAYVPYYRDLFARLGLQAADIRDRRDLPRLPILTKETLVGQFENLKPLQLPQGVNVVGTTRTSGSTGPPTIVLSSDLSQLMFSYLSQRHSRWQRRDPLRTVAWIRLGNAIPEVRPGVRLADGETLRLPAWRHVGVFFETGPNLYFNVTNPVEAQLEWLRRERPGYLLSRPHALVHMALAAGGERPCESLLGASGISEVMRPSMRRYLETAFAARMEQGYGLNEIGVVAGRCDAGRFHVHREHCLVEIVDEAGMPVPPGRAGRLVVTGLQNPAMPLIRYDSDDLVTALDGPCPCGRTLPSFGEVHGRLSRLAPLPDGTLARAEVLRAAILDRPAELAPGLRRYQMHQFRNGTLELRVVAAATLPSAFGERLEREWSGAGGAPGALTISEVAEIPLDTHKDKFDDFVSEFDTS